MPALRFEWDPRKNAANKRKHGVSFEEARSVFIDEHGLLIDDPDHSDDENRFILLGMSASARTLHRPVETMRKSYDFSKARPNPYAKLLKKQVTIRLDVETIEYFKSLAEGMSIPYQTLINLYLRECAANRKELRLQWTEGERKGAA
jgi:uncharacterized DUF497 family protein